MILYSINYAQSTSARHVISTCMYMNTYTSGLVPTDTYLTTFTRKCFSSINKLTYVQYCTRGTYHMAHVALPGAKNNYM